MKFKVGDKVKIKNFKKTDIHKRFGNLILYTDMYYHRNEIGTITKLTIDNCYEINSNDYGWNDEMLENRIFKFGRQLV